MSRAKAMLMAQAVTLHALSMITRKKSHNQNDRSTRRGRHAQGNESLGALRDDSMLPGRDEITEQVALVKQQKVFQGNQRWITGSLRSPLRTRKSGVAVTTNKEYTDDHGTTGFRLAP